MNGADIIRARAFCDANSMDDPDDVANVAALIASVRAEYATEAPATFSNTTVVEFLHCRECGSLVTL